MNQSITISGKSDGVRIIQAGGSIGGSEENEENLSQVVISEEDETLIVTTDSQGLSKTIYIKKN